jgi:hypothetical protein
MPVIFESGSDGPTIRYQSVPLTGLYLRSARKSAVAALATAERPDSLEQRIEFAILAVLWSTLALEAGANERAEDVFPPSNLDDFDRCRKSFRKPANVSRTIWKWHKLFADGPKVTIPLSEPLLVAAEALVQTRHRLSHYQPQRASRKIHYQPPPPIKMPDGAYHGVIWSAEMPPVKVEPSLVESELLGDKPKEHFLAAWRVFRQWEVSNGRDGANFENAVPPL